MPGDQFEAWGELKILLILFFLPFPAIQRTLGVMPDNGVILVFTDEPTTQLGLESAVTAEATRKNVKVFFALLGDPGSVSEQVYKRVSEGRIFRSAAGTMAFDSKAFFEAIIQKVMFDSLDFLFSLLYRVL